MLNCMQFKFWRITEAITASEETMYNFIRNQPSSSVWINIIFQDDKLLEYYDGNNYWIMGSGPPRALVVIIL